MKFIISICFVFFSSLIWNYAYAAPCSSYLPGEASFSIGTINVPASPSVGTVLATIKGTSSGGSFNCPGSVSEYAHYTMGNPTGIKYQKEDVYTTNVPGVGYALCFINCNVNENWPMFVSEQTMKNTNGSLGGNQWLLVLIVIGPVESGSLTTGLYGVTGITEMGQDLLKVSVTDGGTIKATDCTLESESISLPFGDIPVNTFKGPGSTSSPKTFNVSLTCDGQANLSVTLQGNQANSGDGSIIALTTQTNMAKGIGVQFLYNNAPLNIGESLPLKETSGNTSESFEFAARYYQIESTVVSGVADAIATLNLTYQ